MDIGEIELKPDSDNMLRVTATDREKGEQYLFKVDEETVLRNCTMCKWVFQIDDDYYEVGCCDSGISFSEGSLSSTYPDSDPAYRFCPYCGRRINEFVQCAECKALVPFGVYCHRCGDPICSKCTREHEGNRYCETCLEGELDNE